MTINDELAAPLDPARIKTRSQQGRTLPYLEGYDVIDTANRIFGYDGWSYSVQDIQAPTFDKRTLYRATVSVRVHCPDDLLGRTPSRTDIGVSTSSNDTPDAHDTAMKGAVTDGLKRALRTFGSQFGNSLYDKDADHSRPSGGQATAAPQRTAAPKARQSEQVAGTGGFQNVGAFLTQVRDELHLNAGAIRNIIGLPSNARPEKFLDYEGGLDALYAHLVATAPEREEAPAS